MIYGAFQCANREIGKDLKLVYDVASPFPILFRIKAALVARIYGKLNILLMLMHTSFNVPMSAGDG